MLKIFLVSYLELAETEKDTPINEAKAQAFSSFFEYNFSFSSS